MKAYNIKKINDDNAEITQIIVMNKSEISKEYEVIGGPIGGINILPLKLNESDKFIPFNFNGKQIKTLNEMKAAYGVKEVKEVEVKEEEPVLRQRGRPKKVVEDDEDDED